MSVILHEMHMELDEPTFVKGHQVTWEATIGFPALFDSPQIVVNAPNAAEVAARIVKLWNDAALKIPSVTSG